MKDGADRVVQTNELSKYIDRDTALLRKFGWKHLVHLRRGVGDFGELVTDHPARHTLQHLKTKGAPVLMSTAPWTTERVHQAMVRGPHKSSHEHRDFLSEEMASMVEKGQWVVVRYEAVKDLSGLRISPVGVVPQHDRRPRTIVDYTFSGVNDDTVRLGPKEAMQFGKTLQRLLQDIVNADPKYGPTYLCKVDISDGFYRVWLNDTDIPKLGVAFPSLVDGQWLVALPLALPMGWVESPPFFSAATETAADITNARLLRGDRPTPHRLERAADSKTPESDNPELTDPPTAKTATSLPPQHAPPRNRRPLAKFDIYVDDYCGVVQGNAKRRRWARRVLFDTIDNIFRPVQPGDNPHRQEPISVKKLRKGDADWSTRKNVLGWIIDTIDMTLELPARRRARFDEILNEIPPGQQRVSLQKWYRILGELRSMTIAIPGSRGLFSHMQQALKLRDPKGRIRINSHVQATLNDFRWLAKDLQRRPTRLYELIAAAPSVLGTVDASGKGMGGIAIAPHAATRNNNTLAVDNAIIQHADPNFDNGLATAQHAAPNHLAIDNAIAQHADLTFDNGLATAQHAAPNHLAIDNAIAQHADLNIDNGLAIEQHAVPRPLLWRARFPLDVEEALVSFNNPTGTVSNSDLELAGTIMQHEVVAQNFDVREQTIHTSTDNTCALSWQHRGSTSTDGTPAYLLRLQALHQRFHRYVPLHSYLPGPLNKMADDASRLWHLSDAQILTHFETHYPQERTWKLCPPPPAMLSAVTSALRRKRPDPESFLTEPEQPTPIGTSGIPSATASTWIQQSKTLRTQSPCSKSSPNDTAQAPSHPVASLSDLEQWRTPYVPLARRSLCWGPKTRG